MSDEHTWVVTRYETYASFVPSFSFSGESTVHSNFPYSPMPARSTVSAPDSISGSWLNFRFALSPVRLRLGLSLGPGLLGREGSLLGSFRHETLSKSSVSMM